MHANAFGVSIKISDIDRLYSYANHKLKNINFNEGFYEVDFIVDGNCHYLGNLINEVDKGKHFFGQRNSEPLIVIKNITLPPHGYEIIGQKQDTLKFEFNGITYIKFRAKDLIDNLKKSKGILSVTAIGKGNINEWGGRRKPQILLEEIEIKNNSLYEF